MKYCIPTYKRTKTPTVDFLLKSGISDKNIVIGTQRIEDYNYLKQKYKNVSVILGNNIRNVAGNRNQLINFCKNDDYIMLLDDDIISVDTGNKTFEEATEECTHIMKEHNLIIMEWDTRNFGKGTGLPYIWEGWCYGGSMWIVNNNEMEDYNESFDICEDSELALRMLNNNKKIAYYTKYKCDMLPGGEMSSNKTEGGCADFYSKGEALSLTMLSRLSKMYPKQILKTNFRHKPIMFTWGAYKYYDK